MTVSCRHSPCATRSPASLAAAMDRAAMLAPCRRHLSVTSVQLNKRALEHDGGRCDIDCWACSRHVTTQNDVVVWLSIISFTEQVNKYFVLHRVCRDVVYRCRCGVVSVCACFCLSVCPSVCVLDTFARPAKSIEPIEMPFQVWTHGSARYLRMVTFIFALFNDTYLLVR